MLDIKFLRENPDIVKENITFMPVQNLSEVLEIALEKSEKKHK